MAQEDSASISPPPAEQANEPPDRLAEPADMEESPRLSFPVVGVGASAGALDAFTEFFKAMRPDSGMAFVLIQHLPPDRESMLAEILSKHTAMPVLQVEDGLRVEPDHVYVIRPGHTLTIREGLLHLGMRTEKPGHSRPVDDFFKSLAEEQRERAICIVMSGMGSNGSAGAQAIKAVGGLCIAQDPESAEFPSMPRHLIDAGYADYILRPRDMPDALIEYANHPYTRGRQDADAILRREQHHLREVLAMLRIRTRQDFTGYKMPTVLRRIQRRMGLNHVTEIGEYAKLLRENPAEVTALADDLLIHVTGFFRDPEAWEALREQVIVPLVAAQDPEVPVRCWTTACSSGEEAYTLAMLLVEEAERANKPLNIKVFATDMAERMLQNARHGVYPGGIEAELTPQRLERFFERDDALYRIRQDVRERVVFAPQNVLQDPPFSRLDIITCRNLLIYLEPEVQHRLLPILHFGLREGGVLFLGTNETVAGSEDLFEPIDKRFRIYRRIGPTRHGAIEFPSLRRLAVAGEDRRRNDSRTHSPASVAQLTDKLLLDQHAPAAVTVDRDLQIVYFHGNTNLFLNQPRGEATRDLLSLAREGIRDAVRTALNHAATQDGRAAVLDGYVERQPGHRVRVLVSASQLDSKSAPDLFVVSFAERGEAPAPPPTDPGQTLAAFPVNENQLRRAREELQSTIEELQTSNEELKASNEEVMSVNEELQSTNEELETSKEEMQSLNEELTTVNSQLQGKVEEYQAISNDLSSLLASTNIAVIFLDTRFRIRRFTPAMKELFGLISSDIGRPLSDLAKKFTDTELVADAEAVLDNLVPIEKEVAAQESQWFLRRVLPYRTADNRIDGVVVTFVNITERKRAERTRALLAAIVESSADAIIGFNLDGRIISWNPAAERMFGYSRAEATSMNLGILCPEGHCDEERRMLEDLRGGRYVAPFEAVRLAKGGVPLDVSITASLTRTADGEPAAAVIVRDIADRKRAERAMEEAKAEAEAANRTKDDFLATLSHELRTPLSVILLWANMLQGKTVQPQELAEGLAAIKSSAAAQKELIEDLLDTSRIGAGKLRLHLRDVELLAVVQDAIDAILPTAGAKGVQVTTDFGNNIGVVSADSDRIRQVVWNLLINSVKFTPGGGRVEVGVGRRGDEIEIRVSDTGEGMNPDFLPHAFERFRQADASTTRLHGGLGLGLAIAKQLVELHGGTIDAHSDGLGRGATFVVHLPMPKLRRTRAGRTAGDPAGRASEPATVGLAGVHILLVEDEVATRNVLTKLLCRVGAQVTTANSATAAYKAFEQSRPDIIVSDIGLPQEDGYFLIQRIRSREATTGSPPVPAVALTAFTRTGDRQLALRAGFQQHVDKPVEPEHLIAVLQEMVAKK